MRPLKTRQQYKRELNSLIKEYSKINKKIKDMKIDVEKYCWQNNVRYRIMINYRIRHFTQFKEARHRYIESWRHAELCRLYYQRLKEKDIEEFRRQNRLKVHNYRVKHPEKKREYNQNWTIKNPRRAWLSAYASHISRAIINKLWIRPTVCPHCWRDEFKIEFHHPNHLFWWKWTFCCKSCHYFFNRDKVPASDKIIDLKKLWKQAGIFH